MEAASMDHDEEEAASPEGSDMNKLRIVQFTEETSLSKSIRRPRKASAKLLQRGTWKICGGEAGGCVVLFDIKANRSMQCM